MSGPQYITPWGTGSYPTGTGLAWAGVDVSLAPNIDYYTPKVPIDTRYLNWNFQRADQEVVAAQQWAIAGANEWQVATYTGLDGAFSFPSWNPYFGCWMLAAANSSGHPTLGLSMSPGSGTGTNAYTDTSITTTLGAVVPIGVNPANGLGMWFDGSKIIAVQPPGVGTILTASTIAAALPSCSGGACFYQGGNFYLIAFELSGTYKINGTALYSPVWPGTGGGGASGFHPLTVPSTWTTGFATAGQVSQAVCDFPIDGVSFAAYVGVGRNSPSSLGAILNGSTMVVDITANSPLATSTNELVGIMADDADGVLVMLYADAGGVLHVAYSATPSTGPWTIASGIFANQAISGTTYVTGIACIGSVWAIAFSGTPTFLDGAVLSGVFLSSDLGETWAPSWGYYDVAVTQPGIQSVNNPAASFVSNGAQFLWSTYASSEGVIFTSRWQGRPGASTWSGGAGL